MRILLFGRLAGASGRRQLLLALPEKETLQLKDVLDAVRAEQPELDLSGCAYAVNRQFAGANAVVSATDEVAIMPPFSGG